MRRRKVSSASARCSRRSKTYHRVAKGKKRANGDRHRVSIKKGLIAASLAGLVIFSIHNVSRALSARLDEALYGRATELARSLGVSLNQTAYETLAWQVIKDLEDAYEPEFLLANKEDLSHYIVDMYRLGWTSAKYETFKQTFEAAIESARVPNSVLGKEIVLNISSKSPVILGESPNTKRTGKHCFVDPLFYGSADFYLAVAKSCAEHELRHLGMNKHYTGQFDAELDHDEVVGDVLAKCSCLYESMSGRSLEDDLKTLAEKYRNESFERSSVGQSSDLMGYLIAEMMVTATGEMGDGIGKGLAKGEMVGIRLNATRMCDYTPLAETTMLQYAYFFALMRELGGDPQNSDLMKMIAERIKSSRINGIERDFAVAVDIFGVVYDYARSDLVDALRTYPSHSASPSRTMLALAQ